MRGAWWRLRRGVPTAQCAAGCLAALVVSTAAAAERASAASTPVEASGPVAVRVVAFNDLHGHLQGEHLTLPLEQLLPSTPPAQARERVALGGAAALGGLVQALCAEVRHCVVLSSGDLIGASPLISTLFRHESTAEVAAAIGVDAAVVGNHEFDAGWAELQRWQRGGCAREQAGRPERSCALGQRYAGVPFALLGANVRAVRTGAPLLAPSWVMEVGGVKLGVVGAVTRSTAGIVAPAGIAGLQFGDEAGALNREAAVLQARGVRALVALVHEGGESTSAHWNDAACPGLRGPIVGISQRLVAAFGAVLSAHTHQGYRCQVDGRHLLQATSYGRGVSVVDLQIDRASGRLLPRATRSINLPVLGAQTASAQRAAILAATPQPWRAALADAKPLETVRKLVARYAELARPLAERHIAPLQGAFERGDAHEASGTLGRLVADAQQQQGAKAGAQLALTNSGGLRANLRCAGQAPCAATYGQVFEVQPFGNSVVVLTLTGAQLKALLEAQQGPRARSAHLLHVSHALTYEWHAGAPYGQRVRALMLNGRKLASDATVRVAVNSYLADGGDGARVLRQGTQREVVGQDVDALASALHSRPHPDVQPRVQWVP